MAVKIKLKRLGKIREPHYRIVVADSRTKRDGRAIEEIGKYYPKSEPSLIEVNSERAQHWLSVGAKPTDPVMVLLKITGDWQKFTGEPGAEGTLRTAEPRADKKEAFTEAAKASQASKEAKESKGRDAVQGGQARQGHPAQGQCSQGQCSQGPGEGRSSGRRGQGPGGRGDRRACRRGGDGRAGRRRGDRRAAAEDGRRRGDCRAGRRRGDCRAAARPAAEVTAEPAAAEVTPSRRCGRDRRVTPTAAGGR